MELIRIAFFSSCVACGIAVLRGTKFSLLRYIFIAALFASFFFNMVNGCGYTFAAGILSGFFASVIIGASHRKGMHSYLFLIIPVVYPTTPGVALYKMFLAILQLDAAVATVQLIYILKTAVGIWAGINIGTVLMNKITNIKAEAF